MRGIGAGGQIALRDLLIAATRHADDPKRLVDHRQQLELLVERAPVEALPDLAAIHRVGGLAGRGLTGVPGVPEEVQRELRSFAEVAGVRHLMHVGALATIGESFDAAGLRWVVMKGPVLSGYLYAHPGDRSYGDLDLLVDRRDFPTAVRILEKMGFRHAIRNWALAQEQMAGEISLESDQISIDLHWTLHYSDSARRSFDLRPEALIERSRRLSIGPMVVPTFDDIDTVLTLCFHAARSDGHRLIWLKDIERALASERLDLDEVRARAADVQISAPVGIMLRRARRYLGAEVDDRLLDELLPRSLRLLDRQVCAWRHPIQFDEDPTITRWFTRSTRSTAAATVSQIPPRFRNMLKRRFFPPEANESDDENEKERYFDAVVASSRRSDIDHAKHL